MPLLSLQRLDEQGTRLAFDALNGYLERLAYSPYIGAPLVPSGSAVLERPTFGGTAGDVSAVRFPAGVTSILCGSFALPPQWVSGQLSLSVLYSGTVSSTANATLNYDLLPVAIGAVVGQGSLGAFSAPGPATTGFLCEATVPNRVTVTAASRFVAWKLFRIGGDPYAGDLTIFGVAPLWLPSKQ